MPCGADALTELMKEVVLPAVSKVVFDRAPSVRKQFVVMLAAWFQQISEIRQFQAPLLPLLLAGVVDESPEVQQTALQKIDELATVLAQRSIEDSEAEPMTVDEGYTSNVGSKPPAYFSARPALSTRKLAVRCEPALRGVVHPSLRSSMRVSECVTCVCVCVCSVQGEVLPVLLEKTSDWTVRVDALRRRLHALMAARLTGAVRLL